MAREAAIDWHAVFVTGQFATFKTHTVSTANPPFVSKLLKLCKIQQARRLGASEKRVEPFSARKIVTIAEP
jgi:hypothetical protein